MRIVTTAQMKQIEKNANSSGLSYLQMMENAGAAAYQVIRRELPQAHTIAIVAGKGNNGGDGLVIARLAAQEGLSVYVLLAEGLPVTADAKLNYNRLADDTVQMRTIEDTETLSADVVVDALYGTGFHGSLRPAGAKACRMMQEAGAYVVALDLPSGTHADTGAVSSGAVCANLTIAFDSYKQVHVEPGAAPSCGRIVLADIGIPEYCRNELR